MPILLINMENANKNDIIAVILAISKATIIELTTDFRTGSRRLDISRLIPVLRPPLRLQPTSRL